MTTEMMISRVVQLAADKAGTTRALAAEIGVSHVTVAAWKNGLEPRSGALLGMLSYIGGDISRAMPDWVPANGMTLPPIPVSVIGTASAGDAILLTSSPLESFLVKGDLWRTSPWWPLTHRPVVGFQIVGDSLSPGLCAGDLLMCRPPIRPDRIAPGAPVIFRDSPKGPLALRLLFHGAKGECIAVPPRVGLSPSLHETKNIRVCYFVIGRLEMGRGHFLPATPVAEGL